MLGESKFNINLLSHDIAVEVSNPELWAEGALGRAYLIEQRIMLNSAMPRDVRSSTLLHEIVHIIDGLSSIELTETQVGVVALGMYSLIKENPELISDMFNVSNPCLSEQI